MSESQAFVVSIGEMVRFFRQQQQLTLADLAVRAHVSLAHVQRIEHGQGNVTVRRLFRLAEALGVDINMLCPVREELSAQDFDHLIQDVPRPVLQAICQLLVLCKSSREHS